MLFVCVGTIHTHIHIHSLFLCTTRSYMIVTFIPYFRKDVRNCLTAAVMSFRSSTIIVEKMNDERSLSKPPEIATSDPIGRISKRVFWCTKYSNSFSFFDFLTSFNVWMNIFVHESLLQYKKFILNSLKSIYLEIHLNNSKYFQMEEIRTVDI